MLKSNRIYLKSNYIKNTKTDWVYCDAEFYEGNKIHMLKLSSVSGVENETDDYQSQLMENLTVKNQNCNKKFYLNVVLNLTEFKSCDIKPINFRNREKFGLKLVPSGVFSKKKLIIVPENDADVTSWWSAISEFVQKHKDAEHKKPMNNTENGVEDLQVKFLKDTSKTDENLPIKPLDKSDEIYFALDENDVYESSTTDNSYVVSVEDSTDSRRLGIHGNFLLRIKEDTLELADLKKGETIYDFPLVFIRRFGAKKDVLRLEAGRRCSTGEGYFMFRFHDASKAVERIREAIRELKKSGVAMQQIDDGNQPLASIRSTSCDLQSDMRNSVSIRPSISSRLSEPNVFSPVNLHKSQETAIIDDKDEHLDNGQQVPQANYAFLTHQTGTIKRGIIPPLPESSHKVTYATQSGISTFTDIDGFSSVSVPTTGTIRKVPHPLCNSINSVGLSSTTLRPPLKPQTPTYLPAVTANNKPLLVNTAFNRNHFTAASFSHRIPVLRNDSYHPTADSGVYDNVSSLSGVTNDRCVSSFRPTEPVYQLPSTARHTSSFTLPRSLTTNDKDKYDNVPDNYRCIRDLETMLSDLGIPTN